MSERMVGAFRVRVARSAGEEQPAAIDVVRRAGQGGVGLMWTTSAATSAVTSATCSFDLHACPFWICWSIHGARCVPDQPLVTATVVVVCATRRRYCLAGTARGEADWSRIAEFADSSQPPRGRRGTCRQRGP